MSALWKKTLGVVPSNGFVDVKKKYHKLALARHPNKPGGSTEAFQTLGQAWELAQKHYSRPHYSRPRPGPRPPPKKKPAQPARKKKPAKPAPQPKPRRPTGFASDRPPRAPVVMTDVQRPIVQRLCMRGGQVPHWSQFPEVRGADIEALWQLKLAAMQQCALPAGGCAKLRNMWETPFLDAFKILRGDAAIETDIRTMNYLVGPYSRLRNVMPELYDAGKALFDEIRRVAELGGINPHQNGLLTAPAYDAFLELVRRGHIRELAAPVQAFKNVRDGLLRCFDTRASRHLNAHRLVPAHARDTRAEHFLAKLVDEFKEKICDSSKWSSWF